MEHSFVLVVKQAYQCSQQCVKLWKEGWFEPDQEEHSGVMKIRNPKVGLPNVARSVGTDDQTVKLVLSILWRWHKGRSMCVVYMSNKECPLKTVHFVSPNLSLKNCCDHNCQDLLKFVGKRQVLQGAGCPTVVLMNWQKRKLPWSLFGLVLGLLFWCESIGVRYGVCVTDQMMSRGSLCGALGVNQDPKDKNPVIIAGKDVDEVDNDFFLCPVKILDHTGSLSCTFPVENRLIPQGKTELKKHLQEQPSRAYVQRLSDFHVLLYLAKQCQLDDSDVALLCKAVRYQEPVLEGYRVIIDSIAGIG